MKNNVKKILAAAFLGCAITFGSGLAAPVSASAAYADSTSYVYQWRVSRYDYMAINVVDDDGTVYTFEYKALSGSDDISFRIYGESQWRGWPEPGPGATYTHLQRIASVGWHAAFTEYRKTH